MQRRSFLTGVGALFAAPAIVHAENLMKIVVPSREIIPATFPQIQMYSDSNIEGSGWPHDTVIIHYGTNDGDDDRSSIAMHKWMIDNYRRYTVIMPDVLGQAKAKMDWLSI